MTQGNNVQCGSMGVSYRYCFFFQALTLLDTLQCFLQSIYVGVIAIDKVLIL